MKRESNLELCRIVSMIMIILNHVVSLGNVLNASDLQANTFLSLFFLLGGKFGTNVFVIIGLYFLVDQKQFKSQRVMRIWMQTLFYSISLNLLDMIVFSSHISLRMWVKSILPIMGRSYWFASSYIILLLLVPLLNKVYEKLNVGLYQILAATLIFSVLPTLTFNGKLLGNSPVIRLVFKLLMFGPVWFSYLYFVVRYIKTHWKSSGGGYTQIYINLCLFL